MRLGFRSSFLNDVESGANNGVWMRLFLLLPLVVFGCGDETISGYADPKAIYRLVEIDGAPFTPRATIAFPEEGEARGEAPCNRWSATQSVPYPWFEIGPVATTRRACPDLDAEVQFLSALEQMALAEVLGKVLILSNDAGREMVFERE